MNFKKGLKILQKRTFQTLIFLLPTQFAFHFWPSWSHVYGIRVDYLSPAIYLTDAIILLLFLFSLVDKKLFSSHKLQKIPVVIFSFLIVFAIVNVTGAVNHGAALLKWGKIVELTFLVFYVSNKKDLELKEWVKLPLLLSLTFFGLIALSQFYFQKTLGGFLYYFGERSFNASTPAIALYSFLGSSGLRAYSTFSHPNSLAGFFTVSLFLLLSLSRKSPLSILEKITSIVALVTLFISFSVGSWIAFVFGMFLLFLSRSRKIFCVTTKFVFWVLIFASFLSLIISRDFKSNSNNYSERIIRRIELTKASGEIFSTKPIMGVGLNNFIVELPKTSMTPSVVWWLQPVHNIFLLILSEGGLVGLLIFIAIFYKALVNSLLKQRSYLTIVLMVIAVTGVVDHYWFTLQQNQLLFSIIFGLSFRKNIS